MTKALKILTVAVDVFLLLDIATDLCRKYRERKAKKLATVSDTTEEEPDPEDTTDE